MKKILFIFIVGIQIVIIGYFTFQFSMVRTFGSPFTVVTKPDYSTYHNNGLFQDFHYFDYEIAHIPDSLWPDNLSLDDHDTIYILLEKNNNGIYEFKTVSKKKTKVTKEDDIVIQANYSYYNKNQKIHNIEFPFTTHRHIDKFGSFSAKDVLEVTIYKGPFGQYEIKTIQVHE